MTNITATPPANIHTLFFHLIGALKNKIKVEQPNARETPLDAVEKSVYKEKSIPNI